MNRKLKIYSGMLIAAILVFVLTHVFHYNAPYWYENFDNEEMSFVNELPSDFQTIDSIDGGKQVHFNATFDTEVNVVKKNDPSVPTLISQAGEQKSIVSMKKVSVSLPIDKVNISIIPFIIAAITSLVIVIWILWLIYKVVRDIRRGEFFNTQFSKTLETAGILLSVSYIIEVIFGYILYHSIAHKINIAYYTIVYKDESNPWIILMGLSLMIISQIVLIAKDIKDEQDLTI